jgi:hypothetical protein
MNALAVTRNGMPATFRPESLTPREVATSRVLPELEGFGFRSGSEINSLPFFFSTIIAVLLSRLIL